MNISWLYVAAQFALIAVIFSPVAALLSTTPRALIGLCLIVLALLLAAWARLCMQAGTFRILPEPTPQGSLCIRGPYAHVRHPMYSAVMIGSIGACISHATLTHLVALVSLTIVLVLKAQREEQLLGARYTEYAGYKQRTKAYVPHVF